MVRRHALPDMGATVRIFLQTHATRADQIVIPSDEDVSPFERMLLLTVEGHVPGESDG